MRVPVLKTGLLSSAVLSFAAIIGLALAIQQPFGLSRFFLLKVIVAFGGAAALVVVLSEKYLPGRSFGAANRVTLARCALTALLFALIGEFVGTPLAWFAVIVASVALSLDFVDGWLARSRYACSEFGARFDMETDAFLILVTSVLAWQSGKAGPWVVSAGLMRYVFAGFGRLLPWMRSALPASWRRKAVCVVQALSLILCLSPFFPKPHSDFVAVFGLLLLTWSFAVDVAWLAREKRVVEPAATDGTIA